MWIWLLISAAVVLLDQATKLLTVHFLEVGESADLIGGVFRFTYVQNRGAAFGMLSNNRWIFMIISVLAIGGMLFYLWKYRPKSAWACVALSMIIGGGVGNMIDRVRLGYVIDMLDFYAFDFWMWVFNVADACVCVGAGILFVWCLCSIVVESKAEKAKKAVPSEESEESDV